MDDDRRERNRAMRVAYGHARRRRPDLARRWRDLAAGFHVVEACQEQHLTALIEGGGVHPGQLQLVEEAPPEAAQP